MTDRAMQALYLLGLDPIEETLADRHSYGFRLGRCCADALAQCHKTLAGAHGARWVLEGDIKSCFDRISHDWLLANVPLDKVILRKWLKAGFLEKGAFFATTEGTPQGGIISPALANRALDGLEPCWLAGLEARAAAGDTGTRSTWSATRTTSSSRARPRSSSNMESNLSWNTS